MRKSLGLMLAVLLLTAPPALALRCGRDLVDIGAHRFEVLAKCGQPAMIDRWERHSYLGHRFDSRVRRGSVEIEEWTYNFGSRRFVKILRFENGRLVSIENAGYGFD